MRHPLSCAALFVCALALPLLTACSGQMPADYRTETITTPGGTYQISVGEGILVPTGADGKPLPAAALHDRPFTLVPHDILTPDGRRTVYVRRYE